MLERHKGGIMRYRRFGRTGIQVSEIGFGAWGIGGGMWGKADDSRSTQALERAIELGLNFIDTAFDYGDGHSETVVGRVVRSSGKKQGEQIHVATKIPPRNRTWPARKGSTLDEVFPAEYIEEYVHISLKNLGFSWIDLMQFHVWDDAWAERDEWKEAVTELKRQRLVRHWGISINDFQPENALAALETGLIDTVQVIYNIFEQTPADKLFPVCQRHDIGVIARVPLDEGGLTGTMRPGYVFEADDWRSHYFRDDRLEQLQAHLDRLAWLVEESGSSDLAEAALRFCLSHPAVSTVIPGMRSAARAEQNCAISDGHVMSNATLEKLRSHAWQKNWYN
jgi:aryl-alcohol dehydrogenase-like predicted oxidoreductase